MALIVLVSWGNSIAAESSNAGPSWGVSLHRESSAIPGSVYSPSAQAIQPLQGGDSAQAVQPPVPSAEPSAWQVSSQKEQLRPAPVFQGGAPKHQVVRPLDLPQSLALPPTSAPTVEHPPAGPAQVAPLTTTDEAVRPGAVAQYPHLRATPESLDKQQKTEHIVTDLLGIKPQGAHLSGASTHQSGMVFSFQNLVAQSLGYSLVDYRQKVLQSKHIAEPHNASSVSADYLLGPGDEIFIRCWGQLNLEYTAQIDRSGMIFFPEVGLIPVAGTSYQDLSTHLYQYVSKYFHSFELSAHLGALRKINITITGFAKQPGTYQVSPLSLLLGTLLEKGGPSQGGSLRHIEVRRQNKLIKKIDLYQFLIFGDKAADIHLSSGDVIHYSAAKDFAAITGAVHSPAIYEINPGTRLKDLLDISGGLTVSAGKFVSIERIDPVSKVRTLQDIALDLDSEAGNPLIQNGDIVIIRSISPKFKGIVTVTGHVAAPMRFPWHQGLRVSDIIPDSQALVNPRYWIERDQRLHLSNPSSPDVHGQVAQRFPEINWGYAAIERVNPSTLKPELIPFNLSEAIIEHNPNHDILLKSGDIITIFSKQDIRVKSAKHTRYVRVEGEVQSAGIYPIQVGQTLRDAIRLAGGLTSQAYLYGMELTREDSQWNQEQKLEIIIARLRKEFSKHLESYSSNLEDKDNQATANIVIKSKQEAFQKVIAKLKTTKPKGRVILPISYQDRRSSSLPKILLENNDSIYIPPNQNTVSVYTDTIMTSVLWNSKLKTSDYIRLAGGVLGSKSRYRIFVLHANGSMSQGNASGFSSWFSQKSPSDRISVHPGDSIIAFEETENSSRYAFTKEILWSLYKFGLGLAAIDILRQ